MVEKLYAESQATLLWLDKEFLALSFSGGVVRQFSLSDSESPDGTDLDLFVSSTSAQPQDRSFSVRSGSRSTASLCSRLWGKRGSSLSPECQLVKVLRLDSGPAVVTLCCIFSTAFTSIILEKEDGLDAKMSLRKASRDRRSATRHKRRSGRISRASSA